MGNDDIVVEACRGRERIMVVRRIRILWVDIAVRCVLCQLNVDQTKLVIRENR